MKEVTLKFYPGGQVEVDVTGVKGASCKAETDQIKDILGGIDVKEQVKPEFYQRAQEKARS